MVGAHGIRGEVRVRYLGDAPDHLLRAARLELVEPAGGAREVAVEAAREGRPGEVRMRLAGVEDRDQAQALRGSLLRSEAAALAPLEEGEHYWYELIGCAVVTTAGQPVGTVRELWETGAHDVLVVDTPDGETCLIPTAAELLVAIDVEARRLPVAALPGPLGPAETRNPAGARRRRQHEEDRTRPQGPRSGST